MAQRIIPPGMVPAARQRMVLNDSTAISLDSTVQASGANVLLISAETNHARMSAIAPPTQTTGVLIRSDVGTHWFEGYDGTSAIRFQRDTGTCVVNIEAFQQVGS